METIGRSEAKQISEAIAEALKPVEQELGVTITIGGGTFDPQVGTFKPKIEVSVGDAEKNEFALNAPLFALTEDDYEREFESHGHTYQLVAISTRRPKYPFVGRRLDGKQFKFTDAILPQLGVRKSANGFTYERIEDAA